MMIYLDSREKAREIFHPLVPFPNVCMAGLHTDKSRSLRTHLSFLPEKQGPKLLDLLPLLAQVYQPKAGSALEQLGINLALQYGMPFLNAGALSLCYNNGPKHLILNFILQWQRIHACVFCLLTIVTVFKGCILIS